MSFVLAGVSYRMLDHQDDDDKFTVNVEFQMADSIVNTDNSDHWLSIGIKVSKPFSSL